MRVGEWSGWKGEEVKRQFTDRETESRQTDRHRQQGVRLCNLRLHPPNESVQPAWAQSPVK